MLSNLSDSLRVEYNYDNNVIFQRALLRGGVGASLYFALPIFILHIISIALIRGIKCGNT